MRIRDIIDDDLDAIHDLLCEGFPGRDASYWRRALNHLTLRPHVPGYPRFGFLIEDNASPHGVILLISRHFENGVRSNLSSWYVRQSYRQYATFLYQRALKINGGTFLNLSPSQHVLPIIQAFGFKPYTRGTIVLDASLALRSAGTVRCYDLKSSSALDATIRALADTHLSYGCAGLVLEDSKGAHLALYRLKWLKNCVPVAQFVYGTPATLIRSSGGIMRLLLSRGIPIAFVDAPLHTNPEVGRLMSERGIRYCRGASIPQAGDLLESEIAIFGP